MKSRELRLSRPVYEGLPWFYVLSGLLALAASYFNESRRESLLIGILGLLCLLGGVVVLLRRRDYREMRANNYLNPDSSNPPQRED